MLFNVREDIPIKQDGRVHTNDGKIPMLMREHSGKISEKSAVSSSPPHSQPPLLGIRRCAREGRFHTLSRHRKLDK